MQYLIYLTTETKGTCSMCANTTSLQFSGQKKRTLRTNENSSYK